MTAAAYWATIAVSVVTITAGFTGAIRWLVKHYLGELKNNGGSTFRDKTESRLTAIEARVETIITLLTKGQ